MKILDHFDQLSEEWFRVKAGIISMSHAKALLTKGNGQTRRTYLERVASQVLCGPEPEGYQSLDMVRGVELERFAVRAYEAVVSESVASVGFVLQDDERIGCSPDGLTRSAGLEIKCPLPKHHIRYLNLAAVKKDHGQQVQGGLWVCERDRWDFVSFCPWVKEVPLIVHHIYRDEAVIHELEASALKGADEVAEMVEGARAGLGPLPEINHIAAQASAYWATLTAGEGKVQL